MPEFLYFRFFNLSGLIHSHWSCGGEKEKKKKRGRREEDKEEREKRNTHKEDKEEEGRTHPQTVKLLSR